MTIDLATINFIPGQGGGGVIKSLSVTSNGVYSVSAGVDGYNPVDVDVHPSESLQRTYTSNGIYNITGEFNGGMITVDVSSPQFVTETLNVSENGTYNPRQGIDGYSQVVVDVPIDGWDQKSVTEGMAKIINLDNSASFVASGIFQYNTTIQTVNLPYATSVGDYAFLHCTSLSQVNLPVCGEIGKGALENCSSLSQISLPMCSLISGYAFMNCSSLSQISIPMCSLISGYAFYSCSSLSQISLPMCSFISDYAFYGCTSLSVAYIGTSIDTVCVLRDSNTFWKCPALTSIYVPASLVESYKTATNWTGYSDKIVGI